MDGNTNTTNCYKNLSSIELREQLTTFLDSIINSNNRKYCLIKLYNLLLSAETRLDNEQLLNILGTLGTDKLSYVAHQATTSMELELHLRTYVLALEACGKRLLRMTKEFRETLYGHLATLYDIHQRHIKVLEESLSNNYKSECNPYNKQRTTYGLYSDLGKGIKIQNYNVDFL